MCDFFDPHLLPRDALVQVLGQVNNSLLIICLYENFFRYLRCSFKECKGTGSIRNGNYKPGKVAHNHPQYEYYEEDDEFKRRLKGPMCSPGEPNYKATYDGIKDE